jgi:tetratricopeptide (TPR) repeat protein
MRLHAGLALIVLLSCAASAQAQSARERTTVCPQGYEALAGAEAEEAVTAFRACLSERLHEWTVEAELRTRLGAAHLALGEARQALLAYNQVMALIEDHGGNPEIPMIRRNRAAALMQLERYDDALEDLGVAARRDPLDGFTHVLAGSAYMELGRHPEAVAAFDEAVRAEPGYAAGWIGRSAAFIELDMLDQAVSDGREAVSIDPADGGTLNALCWALVKAGRAEEGLEICDAAMEAEPDSGAIVHSRAAALEQVGRAEEARELYARAYELDPGNDTVAEDYLRTRGDG